MFKKFKDLFKYYAFESISISVFVVGMFAVVIWGYSACSSIQERENIEKPKNQARQMCQDYKTINSEFDCTNLYKDAGLIK